MFHSHHNNSADVVLVKTLGRGQRHFQTRRMHGIAGSIPNASGKRRVNHLATRNKSIITPLIRIVAVYRLRRYAPSGLGSSNIPVRGVITNTSWVPMSLCLRKSGICQHDLLPISFPFALQKGVKFVPTLHHAKSPFPPYKAAFPHPQAAFPFS